MADESKTGGVQDKLIALLVVALLVSTGGLGYLYGQLKAIGGGAKITAEKVAGAEDEKPTAEEEEMAPLTEEQWKKILENPTAEKGNKDAEVTLVEFTDYQCPFCGRHFKETDSKIQEEYVKTNKIRYITRDLPLPFHANAHLAAEAARCAGDQGKFWEMHDKLFTNQEEWSEGDAKPKFAGYATSLGMNTSTFSQCLDAGKYKKAVDDDAALASEVGANGTPTFFINGEPLVGAQPYDAFKSLIDGKL